MKKLAFPAVLIIMAFFFIRCHSSQSTSETRLEKTPDPSVKFKPVIGYNGRKLYPPAESPSAKQKKDSLLAIAQANYEMDPDNPDNIIWFGRRTAYLWQYHEAIDIYTKGIQKHPESPELYRHRGHRYISIRRFDKAIADFERAAELAEGRPMQIEPDGLPNAQNIPLSNLQFNIYYHWGLAHYLKGEFERAAGIYEKCMDYSINSDLIVATVDWLYMTYRRMGHDDKAGRLLANVNKDMTIIENHSYFNRLMMYKGLVSPESLLNIQPGDLDSQLDLATQGYGLGNWYRYNGDYEKALAVFEKLLESDYWSAFGYIAAEADMKRGF